MSRQGNIDHTAFLNLVAFLQERDRDFSGNEELLDSLRSRGTLTNNRVIEALTKVPRGDFVPDDQLENAYIDSPLRLENWGFNISAPHMYCVCLEALNPQPGMSFLDIGSGCGHMTALASYLVGETGHVVGLDIRQDIIHFGVQNVEKCKEKRNISLNCNFENRNCFIPDIENRKFDRIHCGASCPVGVLSKLSDLLNPNGILITPCGNDLLKIVKDDAGEVSQESICSVRYGELILPSEAEIHSAIFENERKRAKMIKVPNSSLEQNKELFRNIENQIPNCLNSKFSSQVPTTDLVLKLGSNVYYCHREVLAARSDFFHAQFYSKMRDSDSHSITIIPNSEQEAFVEFLNYLYKDEANITSDNVVDLLELSNFYQVERLKCQCELFMRNVVDIENVCEILEVADQHAAFQLKNFCLSFIAERFPEVSKTESFQKLPRDLLVDITSLACSQLLLATETHHQH